MNPSPGPWKLTRQLTGASVGYSVIGADGQRVFALGLNGEEPAYPPMTVVDNAALVVAAPEMREMLIRLEWVVGSKGGRYCPDNQCGIPEATDAKHRNGCALAALLERIR